MPRTGPYHLKHLHQGHTNDEEAAWIVTKLLTIKVGEGNRFNVLAFAINHSIAIAECNAGQGNAIRDAGFRRVTGASVPLRHRELMH